MSQPDERLQNDSDLETAKVLMSISGPCRAAGDAYLACVATAGLGQCKHLRRNFLQCTEAAAQSSHYLLQSLGDQMCPQFDGDTEGHKKQRLRCAVEIVNQQFMAELMGGRPSLPFLPSAESAQGNDQSKQIEKTR